MARKVKEKKKWPWRKFYPADWRTDPCLSQCKPATRGIWWDLVSAMMELETGELGGTVEQLARVGRCNESEMIAALADLQVTKTANISEKSGIVRIVSRRLSRECNQREEWRMAKQRQRCPDDVPPLSPDCPQIDIRYQKSDVIEKEEKTKDNHETNNGNGAGPVGLDSLFTIVWSCYPANRRGDPREDQAEFFKLAPSKSLVDSWILPALDKLKESRDWKEGFIPGFGKFLRTRAWEAFPPEMTSCETCGRTGVVLRDADQILPWSLELECEKGLQPEVCPACHGHDRIEVPGLPDLKFG